MSTPATLRPMHRRGPDGDVALFVADMCLFRLAAAMQVGAEFACAPDAPHGGHHPSADHQHAHVAALGFRDVFLHEDVDVGRAERFHDRFRRCFGFRQDHAHALRALDELDDDGRAAHLVDDVSRRSSACARTR